MQPLQQNSPPKTRLLYLDGLRGFAALMVVLFHFWGGAGNPAWPVRLTSTLTVDLLSPIGGLGGSRTSLFFVLSGFLLYLPFARRETLTESGQAPTKSEETFFSWLQRRIRRLALPYYAGYPARSCDNPGHFLFR
ncbi:MAG: acyltransferase [Armatimonas sp.]